MILVSKIVTLISFILGTILFALFLYLGEGYIPMMIGFKFLIAAVLINAIFFFCNLILAIIRNENNLGHLKTCGIILLNIPIAITYFYIIIHIHFPVRL
jgi:hypothetical protein